MPDEDRVFDVTKPKNVSPSASSRPIIVGHQPRVSDPMVKDQSAPATRIMVSSGTVDDKPPAAPDPVSNTSAPAIIEPPVHDEPPAPAIPHYEGPAVMPLQEEKSNFEPPGNDMPAGLPANAQPPAAHPAGGDSDSVPPPDTHHHAHIEGLHLEQRKSRRRMPIFVLAAVAVIALVYLGLDAAGINLPFHVLKHKQPPAATTTAPPAANNNAATTSVPAGFKEYKLAQTSITFAAPIAWGDPTSIIDPGYSKRGGTNPSDGTYAYLVDFATNKDIEIAVTSDKYLPAARTAVYYDYLQWCTGTNDGKYYESILHFTTDASKVDTPATITCDQGPVAGAVKLNATTIVQARATDSQNKVLGDIYTKNLNDPSLVVFRVKDAATTNGDQIKQLLDTVRTGTSS
jgi:hypothetical protein